MTEAQARDEICRVGRSLFAARGVRARHGGQHQRALNESQGGGYLITPTDACLGFLDPARLARVDSSARQLSGDLASKTMALHAQIYAAACHFDQKTCCVVHTHSAHCVALTLKPGQGRTAASLDALLRDEGRPCPRDSVPSPGCPRGGTAGRGDYSSLWRSRDPDSRGHARAPRPQCLAPRVPCGGHGHARGAGRNRPAYRP